MGELERYALCAYPFVILQSGSPKVHLKWGNRAGITLCGCLLPAGARDYPIEDRDRFIGAICGSCVRSWERIAREYEQ